MTIKFKNDQHYEECIVQALLSDSDWAEQMVEVLNLDYFNLEYLRELSKVYFDYYKKYNSFPSVDLVATITKDFNNITLKESITNYLKNIKSSSLNGDLEYVKESSLDFCRKRSLAIALESSLGLIQEQKYDQIVNVIEKALLAGSEKNIGHVYADQFEARMTEIIRNPIPTPWPEINSIVGGGLGRGELGVLCAPTGCGKSHGLVDLGHHAAKLGYNVAHYTMELGEIFIGKRYDARISGILFDDLCLHKEEVQKNISDLKGQIVIKPYPGKSVTTVTLKNHVRQLTLHGKKPDLVIVDYGDLLKSKKNYDQKRLEEESAYEDLKALAIELNVPIWTATQTNREGLEVEVVTLKYVAECFGKAMISDFFLTLNRKKENSITTVGNFFVAKNRLGADGIKFPVLVNTGLSKLEIVDPSEVEDGEKESLNGYELLKKRFKDYKESGGLE